MKRILLLVAGVVGVLVGLGLIMPAVALWRSGSPQTSSIAFPLFLGLGLVAAAVLALVKGAAKSLA
ncbi:MAG TPA: hypothetical protein VMB21_11550 [Candidatus Limnocylindria bacterium]|jgi:hypothetical protein|nr:hypothetical protein [Candidatus Limnocylindria bacterium]